MSASVGVHFPPFWKPYVLISLRFFPARERAKALSQNWDAFTLPPPLTPLSSFGFFFFRALLLDETPTGMMTSLLEAGLGVSFRMSARQFFDLRAFLTRISPPPPKGCGRGASACWLSSPPVTSLDRLAFLSGGTGKSWSISNRPSAFSFPGLV